MGDGGAGAAAGTAQRGRGDGHAGGALARRAAPGVAELVHDLRDTPELETFVAEQLGPLLADRLAAQPGLLVSRGLPGRRRAKAEAARALHLERQSLYLRLRRIEEVLGVSLDDQDVISGLHLAVRALRFRRGLTVRRARGG